MEQYKKIKSNLNKKDWYFPKDFLKFIIEEVEHINELSENKINIITKLSR